MRCRLAQVILDEACSSPVLTVSGGSVLVLARSDAVLLEPKLLLLLIKAWRQLDSPQETAWEVDGAAGRPARQGSLWALALCCARALLADGDGDGDAQADHPRRAFNHYQMSRVDLLRHLLVACKVGPRRAAASAAAGEGCSSCWRCRSGC